MISSQQFGPFKSDDFASPIIRTRTAPRGSVRIFESLATERAQRDPLGKKPLVCLMDGDRHLWSLQREYLPSAIGILDLFHVMEYLWLAAHCFHREASLEAGAWVDHRTLALRLFYIRPFHNSDNVVGVVTGG